MKPLRSSRPGGHGRQAGFSLIEALVALLLLSVGLLGLAGLQLLGMQSSHSAYQRTVATVIAMDAGERLWIRLGQDGTLDANALSDVEKEWQDFWTNKNSVDGRVSLPGLSDSQISEASGGRVYTILVRWSEERLNEPGGISSFEYVVRLPQEITP
ncbi:type IV pilus modification protein PilV [Ectothiorhodospira shaposhnikovii]|uniref:type IV pilus modification protein PilV n=1 Tax=Ectothiorhodospira shaposhnikovii TaxID=1054 RepID=UPI001EE8A53F|nr:type IV pilus modification protein PilV [Ectothiorhodospira shaposhnikovii]MCG5513284.1 type IV pilus modification protein PilV [Ectothiorhodospira shaposhnikovii]